MRIFQGIVSALLPAFIVSLCLALSGCASRGKAAGKAKARSHAPAKVKNKKGAPAAEVSQGEIIGVIEMVNPEQKYVLIRCDHLPTFPTGTELTSTDAMGTPSKLSVTPEHKGYYLTADIKSGSPQVANLVTHQKSPHASSAPKTTPAAPAAPAPPASPPPIPAPAPPSGPAKPAEADPNASTAPSPAAPVFEPVVK